MRKKKLKNPYEMPTLGFHIPEGSELEKKIILKAKKHHDGKTSAYVRKCVENDLAYDGEPTPAGRFIVQVYRLKSGFCPVTAQSRQRR